MSADQEDSQQVAPLSDGDSLDLSVVVPIFNNGELLRARGFPSLRASPHFSRMQVLLIDDGSTYSSTREAVRELAEAHTNVIASFHEQGGSGSASRARNTGHQLASTPIITYLDPDDEVLDDGLWELGATLRSSPDAQLAIGNQLRISSQRSMSVDNLAHYQHHQLCPGLFQAGHQVLSQAHFRSTNLSTLALRTEWLRQTGITQVPGAAGQDSLFFRQVFAAAEAFAAHPWKTYAYHTEVEGSQVNTVTTAYFRRCLLREQAQRSWLEDEDLLDSYLQHGLERQLAWYLQRLSRVQRDQREESAQVLREIAELYVSDVSQHRWRYPETMAFFRRLGVPSWEGLRPWAGKLRNEARSGGQRISSAATRAVRTLREKRR